MPIDPLIARGYQGGIANAFYDAQNQKQRRDSLADEGQRRNALMQMDVEDQQRQWSQEDAQAAAETEKDRLWDAAMDADDIETAMQIDPESTLQSMQALKLYKAMNAPPERDVRQFGNSLVEVPLEGSPRQIYSEPQRAPMPTPQQPARPQLTTVTLPDGREQKQWIVPGEATGTPVGEPTKTAPKVDRDAQRTEIQLAATFANQSKDFNTVSGQYRRVLAVSKKPTPANDFALIYAFAKIQDPTSVVRESEFAQAAKTGAYGDQVAAAIGRVANGKTLTERQRYDFVNAARNAYEAQREQWESSVVAPAKQQAAAYGLDWKNIYKDYTIKESAPEAPAGQKKSFQHRSGATVEILD